MLLLLMATGCADQVEPTELASPVELDASLVQARVDKDQPLILRACVRVREAGWSWNPSFPQVEGLQGGEIQSQVQGQVSCLERAYQGAPGAYIFPPVQVQGTGPQGQDLPLTGPRLYGDIGEPVATSDLGVLQVQPDRRWIKRELDWKGLLLALPLILLGALAGVWYANRNKGHLSAPLPELPPGERALRDWAQARDNPELSDQEKGQALSSITRRYLTHIGAPQALKRTTPELLQELEGDPRLGEWCGVLEHLLSAADTVKFAGGEASRALLAQWSEGLKSLVQAHQGPPKAEQI